MPTLESYVTWFEDDDWISTVVSFPTGSRWRIDSKIREHEYYESQCDVEQLGIHSEARGAILCSKVSGDGPSSAFLKVRLRCVFFDHTLVPSGALF